ncbi:hypothetical protein ACE1ET_11775 [Saccharicrinis sp. FJH62]|uniref:hypothetical protein n=1 Tax=Saccharicrinis sp. FJH62 TaxID=3344657 RepID=UPI0035D4EB31
MKEDKTKEIDLLDLLQSIGRSIAKFFIFLYNAMWWFIVFGVKNYIFMIIFVIIGLGWGIYSTMNSKDVYQSFMKIRSNAMTTRDLKPFISEINTYISNKNSFTYPILEKNLNSDSSEISKITAVKPHFYIDYWGDGIIDELDIKDNHSTRDTLNVLDSTYMCIEARVQDPALFEVLGEKIVTYLNNKPSIIRINDYRLKEVNYKVASFNHEIRLLDSLQNFSYFNGSTDLQQLQFSNRQGLILGENRQQLFHIYKLRLENQKKPFVTELNLYTDPVTIIDNFPIVTTKMESSLMDIIISVIKVALLGYVILLLIYVFKKNYSKYADKV